MATWSDLLKQARRRQGITQVELARRSRVSKDIIASYEQGRREPTSETLGAILGAMNLRRDEADAILTDAGLDRTPPPRLKVMAKRGRPLDAIQAEIDSYPWPSLVTNERYEVIAWNPPATKVAEMDFATELPLQEQRNLMRISAMPHYAEGRVVNWDEIVSFLLAYYKHNNMSIEQPDEDSRYFETLIADLATNPAYSNAFPRMMRLWPEVQPWQEGRRPVFPAVWRVNDDTELRFSCILGAWSEFNATWSFDWFPADAQTWDWLGTPASHVDLSSRSRRSRVKHTRRHTAPHDWFEHLSAGRRASGLTQADLESATGMSRYTISKFENGKMKPSKAAVLALCRAMVLDATTTNTILTALGEPPEPSDWSRFLCGLPLQGGSHWYSNSGAAPRDPVDIRAEIETYPWPCLIVNERCEIDIWNAAMARTLGGDLVATLKQSNNLIAFLAGPGVRSWLGNWDDVITAVVPAEARRQIVDANEPTPDDRLAGTIEAVRREDRDTVAHLRELWSAAPTTPPVLRVTVPIVWQATDGTPLVFHGLIFVWSAYERRWAMDWHPADAVTWQWLAQQA
ncbi:MAG: helix-turn-helix domain-containing protein [Dehalococcoidia bacterium]